jgi:hypothetical protein
VGHRSQAGKAFGDGLAESFGYYVNMEFKAYLATMAVVLSVGIPLSSRAEDKVVLHIGNATISAYRTVDLESAKKEAAAAHKPIAWIASANKILSETGTITRPDGRGATFHAFYALRNRTVLVFEDAFEENHKVLPLVDQALHTPDPHYTPPKVIFLNPDATEVLATVEYEPDPTKRAYALANALSQAEAKLRPAGGAPKK